MLKATKKTVSAMSEITQINKKNYEKKQFKRCILVIIHNYYYYYMYWYEKQSLEARGYAYSCLKKSKNEPVKVVIFADSPFRDEKKKKNFNRRLDEQDNRENILGNVLVA